MSHIPPPTSTTDSVPPPSSSGVPPEALIKRKVGRPKSNFGDPDVDDLRVVRKRCITQDATRDGWWRAGLNLNGKTHYIGSFPTRKEAVEAFEKEVETLGLKKTYMDGPVDLFTVQDIQEATAKLYWEVHEGLVSRDKWAALVQVLKLSLDLVRAAITDAKKMSDEDIDRLLQAQASEAGQLLKAQALEAGQCASVPAKEEVPNG